MKKSSLLYYEKNYYQQKRFILEAKIWKVDDKRYPNSVKYSLAFIDTKSDRKVLVDNHFPKGPHFHLDQNEFDYHYLNDQQLMQDFKNLRLLRNISGLFDTVYGRKQSSAQLAGAVSGGRMSVPSTATGQYTVPDQCSASGHCAFQLPI